MKQISDKNIKTKSKFVLGAIILAITSLVAKILGALYKVPLMHIIGSNGLGIFQLVFPIYSFFLVLVSGGINLGISKLISIELQKNNGKYVRSITKNALVLVFIISVIFSLILALTSLPLSKMQGSQTLYICYLALIPALIFSSLTSVFKGYFQGYENMTPSGISLIIAQSAKLIFGLYLCRLFSARSLTFAVFGAFLGISISEFISCLYLFFKHLKAKRKLNNQQFLPFKTSVKLVAKYSFPIMLNSIIMPLVYAIESAMIVWLLSKAQISSTVAQSLFGLEDGIASSLINLPTVASSALATALLPSITKSFNEHNFLDCKKKSQLALNITWLICLPCFVIFLFFSKDIVKFLYSNGLKNIAFDEFTVVVDLVKISSLNILYVSLLGVVTAILQAINKSFVPVKNLLISAVVKLIVTFVLVSSPKINIYGIVISDIVCFSLALILNFVQLKKHIDLTFSFNNFVLKPAFCLGMMIVIIHAIQLAMNGLINFKILSLVSLGGGAIIYIALIFLTKAMNIGDIIKTKKHAK